MTFRLADDGQLVARRGGGGLVTALGGLARHCDVTWIAHAMTTGDVTAQAESPRAPFPEMSREGFPYALHFVGEPDTRYQEHYSTISNPLLWFVQHRLYGFGDSPTITRSTHRAWESYRIVNDRIAEGISDAVVADPRPDSWVLIHDYQLLLVPSHVRDRGVTSPVLYFHHVPWPDAGALRCLPRAWVTELLESLTCCDVIGVQTPRDAERMLDTMRQLDGAVVDRDARSIRRNGRETLVRSYPISVAVDEFHEHVTRATVRRLRERISALRPTDGSLIVRVDRTDPSKNIIRGFQAWALLLHEHPELHGRVTMYCQLDPSRQEVPEYARYFKRLMAEAGTINATWGSGSWQPLVLNTDPDFAAAVAAYCEYDVLFVNPVADGMNLVSKEGPLINERDGVVVLSEQAGSFSQLSEHVIGVNPFDVAAQADALVRAISLPADQRRTRAQALRDQVTEHDIARWLHDQFDDLRSLDPVPGAAR